MAATYQPGTWSTPIDTTLMAVPFDAASRRIVGGPVPIAEGVLREVFVEGNTSTANYGFTATGTLVYVHGPTKRFPVILRDLVLVSRHGDTRPVSGDRRDYWRPRISPDGTRIAVEVFDGRERHIWICNLITGAWSQLTFDGPTNDFPV